MVLAFRALRHLLRGVVEAHDARADLGDHALGHDEGLAVELVEAQRDVARQLDVLLLVLTHRHLVGVVEEDVGGLQHRIGEEAGRDALLLLRLDLVLRHALEPADRRDALQDPRRLGVRAHVALDEERGALGVDAAGEQHRRQLARAARERLRAPASP